MTRVPVISSLIFLFAFAGATASFAQSAATDGSSKSWIGEWGKYRSVPTLPGGFTQYRGERLAISDCSGQTCKVLISVTGDSGHCDSSGKTSLLVQSTGVATASLNDSRYKCSIELQKSGPESGPVITTVKSSGDCTDFCTPGADFDHTFPLHARTHYVGSNIEDCYLGTSRTQMAVCSNQTLAEKESKWKGFSAEVLALEGEHSDFSYDPRKLKEQCDHVVDPATCLMDKLMSSTADLDRRKDAWLRKVTETGDKKSATSKIRLIAGRYRHSFASGDVQGDTFKTTDKLDITKRSDRSIHYSLLLNFYNGHICSREGVASYKLGGAFVDIDKQGSGDACYFGILPTPTGVKLLDPTGKCKQDSCGERGGYYGAGFRFAEKLKPAH